MTAARGTIFPPFFGVLLLAILAIEYRSRILADVLHNTYIETEMFSPQWTRNDNNTRKEERRHKLGDGCHHVFIDVGANIGVHSRFLFEPEQYPEAKVAQKIFNKNFGVGRDKRDLCAFGFEPNPAHKQRHDDLSSAYAAVGMRYFPLAPVGVSDVDGTMAFYHQGAKDAEKEEDAFRYRPPIRAGAGKKEDGIPVVRLAAWLRNEILDRKLPSKLYGEYGDDSRIPKVVMKVDIEGMEHIVVPDLITSGVLCQTVDYMFMEMHWWEFSMTSNTNITSGLRGGISLQSDTEARDYFRHLLQAFHAPRSGECKKSAIDLLDDESYLHDGVPFPSPV